MSKTSTLSAAQRAYIEAMGKAMWQIGVMGETCAEGRVALRQTTSIYLENFGCSPGRPDAVIKFAPKTSCPNCGAPPEPRCSYCGTTR